MSKRWECEVCGYVHTGKQPPEECPICGASSDDFTRVDESDQEH